MSKNVVPMFPPLDTPPVATPKRVPRGSRNKYTEANISYFCRQLMGTKTIAEICKDPKCPSLNTVREWLSKPERYPEFWKAYRIARVVQAELRIDEIFSIADTKDDDWVPVYDDMNNIVDYKPNNDTVQRSRLMIDTRKWYASKMVPHLYGDSLNMELGASGELVDLLKQAVNNDAGLPPAIDGEVIED